MVYIGNLVWAIERAVRLGISGGLNVTDACPQDTYALLMNIFHQLGCREPRFRVSLDHAIGPKIING
ncbi:hypothetical protein CCP2SC5_310036 [Azospirillaceae bacterium]